MPRDDLHRAGAVAFVSAAASGLAPLWMLLSGRGDALHAAALALGLAGLGATLALRRARRREERMSRLADAAQALLDDAPIEIPPPAAAGRGAARRLAAALHRIGARTARREAERAAQASVLRAALDGVSDAVLLADAKGRIMTANVRAQSMFGYEPEELVGRNVAMLLPERHRGAHSGYIAEFVRTGEHKVLGHPRREYARRRDGGTFPVSLNVSVQSRPEGPVFVAVIEDRGALRTGPPSETGEAGAAAETEAWMQDAEREGLPPSPELPGLDRPA